MFFNFLFMEYKTYAQFNSFTVAGRIFAAEIVPNNGNEFLSVTLITNCVDDDAGMTVTFTHSNGLLALAKAGGLPVGRQVTVTGHIKSISETYTNKDGEVVMLQRPKVHLIDAAMPTGGLGATPRTEDAPKRKVGTVVKPSQAVAPAVDGTPVF